MLYDQLVSELTERGNSYAAYLRAGRPADFWSLSNGAQSYATLGYQEQLADISVPSTPAQPVAAHPPVQQQAATGQQPVAQPTVPPIEQTAQTAPAALADQLVDSGQQPIWQQVSDRGPSSPSGLVFQRTDQQPEGVEVVMPVQPTAATTTGSENGLTATQPMAAVELPQRRPLGEGPTMQAGWSAAQASAQSHPQQSAPVQDYTHLPPRPPLDSATLVPLPGVGSPMERGAAAWGDITQQG